MLDLVERMKDCGRKSPFPYDGEVNPRYFYGLRWPVTDLVNCPVCDIPERFLDRALEAIEHCVDGMTEPDRLTRAIKLTRRILATKSTPEDY